jgi:hypothetical protein
METKEICTFRKTRIKTESAEWKGIREKHADQLKIGYFLHGYFDGISSQEYIIKVQSFTRGVISPYAFAKNAETGKGGDYVILILSYSPKA